MGKRIFLSLIALCVISASFSQEAEKKVELNGYVSTLTSSIFEKLKDPARLDNLIHNRLNFKAYLRPQLTLAAETRNRLFFGDMVKFDPGYARTVATDQGFVDLSWNLFTGNSLFLNTTIDRLWLDYSSGKFQATIGRQRINWGQALVWNPNDIFNAYSYFDFDYTERPGSDAVRLQYYPGSSSTVEFAVKANDESEITAAALYRFNKWSYDIQLLSGILENDEFVAGFGWSGAFGSVSFRGEGTWFKPFELEDTTGTAMLTIGADKFFGNNSMLQAQVLFCNNPYDFGGFTSLYSDGNMSVKDLAFSKFSAFGSYSYPITPLFTCTASAMWFPDREGYFSGLSADYSAAENIDVTLLWQHFAGKFGPADRMKINLAFLRIKFSF